MSQVYSTGQLQHEGFINSPRQLDGHLAKRFKFIAKLGEGTFGFVAAVYDNEKGVKLALKKIKFNTGKPQGIPANSLRQIGILKSLSHPNIVKILDVFYECQEPELSFTMEFHPCNLHEYIKQENRMSFKKIKTLAYQMFSSLHYLHRRGIMHRDLKPQNLLISSGGVLKLCDFGQAKLTSFGQSKHTSDISTLWYRSPEILLGSERYDEKIDIWGAGCILAEMILGKPLFKANSQLGVLFSIFRLLGTPKQQNFPEIIKMQYFSPSYPKFQRLGVIFQGTISKECQNLLNKILIINPSERISIEQILKHDFFSDQQ